MNKNDRLRRNYIHFVAIRQQRGLDKKLQKFPASCYECHHILPTSCGGGNEDSNLVLLTFREHWVAHYLLDQFSEGDDKEKMKHALIMMSSRAKPGELSSVAYAIGKAELSEANAALVAAGKHHWQTEEHRAATSKRNKELAEAGLLPFQSAENRAATSKRMSKRLTEQVTCPHCSKTGSRGGMQRWHFDHCKHNPASKIGNP